MSLPSNPTLQLLDIFNQVVEQFRENPDQGTALVEAPSLKEQAEKYVLGIDTQ